MLHSVELWRAGVPLREPHSAERGSLQPVLDVVDRLIDFLAGLLERALRFAARKTNDARRDESREPRDDAFPIAHLFAFVVMDHDEANAESMPTEWHRAHLRSRERQCVSE